MTAKEFALISTLHRILKPAGDDILTGIGDDAAVVATGGHPLAACTDTLVAGRHFFPEVPASDLAWKSLAVNLSDLAAMGAAPQWALLNLVLPAGLPAAENWVEDFAHGWECLARRWNVRLVGGDTVASDGPLTVTVTALGLLEGPAMLRSGARPGDEIWVSGCLGDAAIALDLERRRRPGGSVPAPGSPEACLEERRLRPVPRIALGMRARALGVRCAQDVSDGFLADLGHILRASGVSAEIDAGALPLSPAAASYCAGNWEAILQYPLTGGDDYELLLCLPSALGPRLLAEAAACGTRVTRVGRILADPGPPALFWQGRAYPLPESGGHEHAF